MVQQPDLLALLQEADEAIRRVDERLKELPYDLKERTFKLSRAIRKKRTLILEVLMKAVDTAGLGVSGSAGGGWEFGTVPFHSDEIILAVPKHRKKFMNQFDIIADNQMYPDVVRNLMKALDQTITDLDPVSEEFSGLMARLEQTAPTSRASDS